MSCYQKKVIQILPFRILSTSKNGEYAFLLVGLFFLFLAFISSI